MSDEKLIRFLCWQNGLARGLLASIKVMRDMDSQTVEIWVGAIQDAMYAPLPKWLENADVGKIADPELPVPSKTETDF